MSEDEQIRQRYRLQLQNVFREYYINKNSEYDEEKIQKMCSEIELSCNNKAIVIAKEKNISPINWNNPDFCCVYSSLLYRISENLDPQSAVQSEYLITQILTGKVKPKNVVNMTSAEMCPERNQKIIEEKRIRLNKKVDQKESTRYQCPNCKKKKTKHQPVQLRSFDEGYNLSITCLNCGYGWVI